jgi:hypothetical protein
LQFNLLWDAFDGFQCTRQSFAFFYLELLFRVMIDGMRLGWDDPGVDGKDLGEKQSRAYLRAVKNVGLRSGREQGFPVLATESMFNRYLQPSPRRVDTSSLTRSLERIPCTEQQLFPRPCHGKHLGMKLGDGHGTAFFLQISTSDCSERN